MKTIKTAIFILFLPTASLAANYGNGNKLHMENCTGCHDAKAYTRPNRRVNSLPQLGKQVRFCRDNLGITWFDDEVNDVIFYLNKDYYQF